MSQDNRGCAYPAGVSQGICVDVPGLHAREESWVLVSLTEQANWKGL